MPRVSRWTPASRSSRSCRRTGSQTSVARGLLPGTVPHADAAANAGRAALLVAALSRQPELLLAATEDRLHQDYREPAMPESLALVRSLRSDGLPAVVSGAGPTVLVFTDAAGRGDLAQRAPDGWQGLVLSIDRSGALVTLPDEGHHGGPDEASGDEAGS